MPDWTPGMQRGKSVKVSFNLPINFKLENSKNKITRIRIIDDIDKDSVYNVVEQMPEYPGGIDALMKYLGSNIKYPEKAKKMAVNTAIKISFTPLPLFCKQAFFIEKFTTHLTLIPC